MSSGRFVSYLRVSTQRQGQSGLGLEAQREAVAKFLSGGDGQLVGEFVEVESGKRNDRPELTKALEMAKAQGATLVIAKLDRLGRNVAFVANLIESGVELVAVDNPTANRMMLQMLAVFAESEAKAISERTKAALAAAKARGVKLGWSIPGREAEQAKASAKAVAARQANAASHARNTLPIVADIIANGIKSHRAIADALNARGIKSARGGRWHRSSVANVLRYAKEAA